MPSRPQMCCSRYLGAMHSDTRILGVESHAVPHRLHNSTTPQLRNVALRDAGHSEVALVRTSLLYTALLVSEIDCDRHFSCRLCRMFKERQLLAAHRSSLCVLGVQYVQGVMLCMQYVQYMRYVRSVLGA
jgi:hypothetical protein